jgi:hypothetical protein
MGEGGRTHRTPTDAMGPSGGVKPTAWGRGCAKQLEKPSSSRCALTGSKAERTTGHTGKSLDGERVAEGRVVALRRGKARGAKAPRCG